MAKEAVFTMKLEPELRDAFMAAAQRADRPASQLVREMMREFVEAHPEPDAAYWAFVQRKVEKAGKEVAEGHFSTQEEVEADMKARHERIMASMNDDRG